MAIENCLAAAVKAGRLSEKGAREYADRMKDAEALAAERGITGPEAYIFATTEAAKAMEKRATNTRAQVQQTILAVDRAWESAKSNTRGTGFGLTTVFGERVAGEGTGASIGLQHRGNVATMQSIMSDFLSKVQSRAAGLKQNLMLPRHVVSELYGRATSGDAGQGAKAWTQAIEWWMDGMRRAGVPVGKLEDWRLPQHFDAASVRAMGKDGFIGQMTEWWVSNKLLLRDWAADGQAYLAPGRPEADQKVREILDRAYDNITTGGDASLEPGAVRGFTLADRYGRRRAFEWATDDAWLEFNRTFGVGDDGIGELMVRHLDSISRDLAVAQVLGPDPDRAAKTLVQMYQKENAGKFGARFFANKLNAVYEVSSGKASAPVSQRLALGAQAFRSFLSSVQLGSAILSAPSDFGFTKATASWHGLDISRIMSDYVSRLKPTSAADRAEAMRSGLILEVGLRGLHDASRDVMSDVVGRAGALGKTDAILNGASQIAGRAAEFVIRAQGLAHHTQILRDAIGSQVQEHFGGLAGKSWEGLSGVDKRTLRTYGLGKAEWEVLRSKAVNQGFLDPATLAREGEGAERDAAVRMLGAIAGIQRVAVPEGNAVTRAWSVGGTRPGTIEGEILRSLAQYKGFPMAAFLQHGFRALDSLADAEGQWFRGQYMAGLVVMTTVLGALSLQLKNIATGKDPEPMDRGKFWFNAFAQGGAGGIIGDQIKALFSAQKAEDPSRLLPPVAGFLLDLQGLTQGNIQDAISGRDPNTGREAVRFARKYAVPNLWYTRLAMDRLVWDTLTKMADPDAYGTFNRMEERARREQGTAYYWRPGNQNPRAPDLSRALQ
tara:strand:- start:32780 stop:35284 length:2505 start_codon:yes stop_codon:yes gene_type:complete